MALCRETFGDFRHNGIVENKTAAAELLQEAIKAKGYGAKSAVARATGVAPQTVGKWTDTQRPTTPSPEIRGHIEATLGLHPGAIAEALASESTSSADRLRVVEAELSALKDAVARLVAVTLDDGTKAAGDTKGRSHEQTKSDLQRMVRTWRDTN